MQGCGGRVAMSKKRKKRSADDPMTGEEEQLMLRMPSACGLPIVERLTVGTEMQRNLNGRPRPDLKTIRAKLCCQGCKAGWTAVMRTSAERSFEEATEALVAKIQEEHLDHHISAIQAAYSASTEGNWHYCMQHLY